MPKISQYSPDLKKLIFWMHIYDIMEITFITLLMLISILLESVFCLPSKQIVLRVCNVDSLSVSGYFYLEVLRYLNPIYNTLEWRQYLLDR